MKLQFVSFFKSCELKDKFDTMKVLCLALLAVSCVFAEKLHPLSDAFIEKVNAKQSTWTAGRNFPEDYPLENIRARLGRRVGRNSSLPLKVHPVERDDLPETFDSREQWPNCASIRHIFDQGNCGSCWAFGGMEAISDRICIHSGQQLQTIVAVYDIVSCCVDPCGGACNGGWADLVWQMWVEKGFVTKACKSNYPYSNDAKDYKNLFTKHGVDECSRSCDTGIDYQSDLTFGESSYKIPADEYQIRKEIYTNGPVEGGFNVMSDFMSYKSGVYQYTYGDLEGGHNIKIIGWGTEDGVPYWLVANSWGPNWGDSGYFKFLRGQDHLVMEDDIVAGIPRY